MRRLSFLVFLVWSLFLLHLSGGANAFCAGTWFYRTSESGGIVAVPKIDSDSPTNNVGLFPLPGTSDSESGISASLDLLCYIVLPDSVKCMNLSSGEIAQNETGLFFSSESVVLLDATSSQLVFNPSDTTLVIFTFTFENNSLILSQTGSTSGGLGKINFAIKSYPPGIEIVATNQGEAYLSRYRYLPGINIIANPTAPEIPVDWVNSNDLFFFRTETGDLYSLNNTNYQYNSIIGNVSKMVPTESTCNEFIIINQDTVTNVSFYRPNASEYEQTSMEPFYLFNSVINISSTTWGSFYLTTQDWMSIPAEPIDTPIFSSPPTMEVTIPIQQPIEGPISPVPSAQILSCPSPGPEPSNLFFCDTNNGLWTSSTNSLSNSDLTLTTEVHIPGTLSISGEITFVGLKSLLNVSGCALNIGSVNVILSKEELQAILASSDKTKVLIQSSCSTDHLASVPVKINVEHKKCERVSATAKSSLVTLSALITVDSKCNIWWISLVSVLGACFLIGLLIIFLGFTDRGKRCLRPFHGTDAKLHRRVTTLRPENSAVSRVAGDSALVTLPSDHNQAQESSSGLEAASESDEPSQSMN